MDAIAHTQVSAVCLVTLVVLLRAQQKMRDKSLPGRLFTALLWSAEALTLVDYNSALAQMGAWQELGIPLTYRLNAGGSILFYLLAACCCQLVFLYVEAELGHTWLEDGRKLAFCAAPLALLYSTVGVLRQVELRKLPVYISGRVVYPISSLTMPGLRARLIINATSQRLKFLESLIASSASDNVHGMQILGLALTFTVEQAA